MKCSVRFCPRDAPDFVPISARFCPRARSILSPPIRIRVLNKSIESEEMNKRYFVPNMSSLSKENSK